MATALVGREKELEFLTARLEEAEGGDARFAAVEGDPGLGKSRLLRELTERASARGCVVLHGRAAEFERELPFGLFVDALDSFLEAAPGSAFGGLNQEQVDELASAFPAMRPLASGDSPAPAPEDRVRVYGATRELLGCLAPGKTVLITLDDLHWSDRASLELIGHLLRRPPRAKLMIVFSFRTRRLDSSALTEIHAAADAGHLGLQRLGPLAPEDAGALLDGNPRAAEILGQCGGNPFYILELSRAAPIAGSMGRSGGFNGVPETVGIAIDRELGGLSGDGRALAHASAVVGDPFSLDLSISAAGLEPGDGLVALDELAGSDLIRSTDVPRRFQFRHPLVRSAVYAAVPEGTRLAIHSLCAELLRDGREGLAVRAHHVEQSAQFGDLEAVELLRDAALRSAARAPASAVRWLRAALRLLPDDAPTELRQELLLPLPGLLTSLSDFNGAYEAALEALDSVAPDQRDLEVAMTIACASFEHALGDRDRAGARLDGAIEAAVKEGGPDAVALLIAKLMDRFYDRSFDEMPEWGEKAVAAAAKIDNRPLRAAAAGAHLMACALGGRIDEALRNRPGVIELIDDLSDEELAERLDAIGCLAAAEMYLDKFEDVVAHGERGLKVGRTSGRAAFAPTLVPCVGTSAWVLGDVELAVETLSAAVESSRVSRNRLQLAWNLLNLALAQAMQGDVEVAIANGEEAEALADELGDSAISSWVDLCLGVALREGGKPDRAIESFTSMMGVSAVNQIPGGWRAHATMELTRAAVAAGRLDLADESRQRAAEAAEATGLPMARAWAERAAAEVLLARGEHAAAAETALASAAGAGEQGARLDRAISRELAGQALLAAADQEAAVEQFKLAAEEFDECKAPRHRDRVEKELGRLGHRPSRRSRAPSDDRGLESLTGREKEVAQLLVDRRTNAEIAAELFLSEKTVESHLRNIFRKLDVGSRVEVARLVEGGETVNVLVAADMEGIAGIEDYGDCLPSHPSAYARGRRLMTDEVLVAVEALRAGGVEGISVGDWHMVGTNVERGRMPSGVEVRPIADLALTEAEPSMTKAHGGPLDAVVMIGHHARTPSPKGFCSHTFIWGMEVLLGGEQLSEVQVYAQGLAAEGIPILVAAGDRWLFEEMEERELGEARLLVTKEGEGRGRARSIDPVAAHADLRNSIAAALAEPPPPPPARNYPAELVIRVEGEEIARTTVAEPGDLLIAVATVFRTSQVSREYRQLAKLLPPDHDSRLRATQRRLGSLLATPVMRRKERQWLAAAG